MNRQLALVTMVVSLVGGCDESPRPVECPRAPRRGISVTVQQINTYPQVRGSVFVSLADFESSPVRGAGDKQTEHFSFDPGRDSGDHAFTVSVIRTGMGAMRVKLAPDAELVFAVPDVHDFSEYTLLSLSLHHEGFRDDLRVKLVSESGSWTSHPHLVKEGWNTVLVDLRPLRKVAGLDLTRVREIHLTFCDARRGVQFCLDDILLIDNCRVLKPTPAGITLERAGLDYTLTLPGWDEPLRIKQGADGLWRVEGCSAVLRLQGPGEQVVEKGEQLGVMGDRRMGRMEVMELNRLRVRLANTWYFPTHAPQGISLDVKKIRWEYTFYPDGRWVTFLGLNDSGGKEIDSMEIVLDREAAWGDGAMRTRLFVRGLTGGVGRWAYLLVPDVPHGEVLLRDYLHPGRVHPGGGKLTTPPVGSGGEESFDSHQGCYVLKGLHGNCRFTVFPAPNGLLNGVFRVLGNWRGRVHVSSQGLVIRSVAHLSDGSLLFSIPGLVDLPAQIEITDRVGGKVLK